MNAHRWGVALATALMLGAAACGGDHEPEGTVGAAGTTDTQPAGTLEDAVLPDTTVNAGTSGTITGGEVGVGTTTGTAATGTTGSVPPQP